MTLPSRATRIRTRTRAGEMRRMPIGRATDASKGSLAKLLWRLIAPDEEAPWAPNSPACSR